MDEIYKYDVNLQWNSDTKGILSSPALQTKIEVATPPEFPKGMAGIWSPEHLFVASINSCLMATFLAIADNSRIEFINYQSRALGVVEKIEGKYIVTQITIEPTLTIPSTVSKERVMHLFEMSEKACAISNSIKSKINLAPIILVG